MNLDTDRPEIHKTGHRWLDMTVALSALFVSIVSMVLAIVHGDAMERMADANARLVAANSWPFLQYSTGNDRNDKGVPTLTFGMTNVGVGPAKIEAVELRWRGRSYPTVVDFLHACCGYHRTADDDFEYSLAQGTVIRAGESNLLLTLHGNSQNTDTWNALNRERLKLELRVCYCSVFDECWTTNLVRFSLNPIPTKTCEVPKTSLGVPR